MAMWCERPIRTRADRFAALLARGETIADAGRALGLSAGETASTWRAIKRELGWQAR